MAFFMCLSFSWLVWVWLGPTKHTQTLKWMLILTDIFTPSFWGTSATWQTPPQPLGPRVSYKLSAIQQNGDPNTFFRPADILQVPSSPFPHGFSPLMLPCKPFMCLHTWLSLALLGLSLKSPVNCLWCVFSGSQMITALWCPNAFQMGSARMVAWVWGQPFSMLAQATGVWTWRKEIS